MIVIDEAGDLTVRVKEIKDKVTNVNVDNQSQQTTIITDFKVCKKVLISSSPVWKALLTLNHFAEADHDQVTLEEDHTGSMEILFRVLHGTSTDETCDVVLEEMWPLVAACDKYNLDIKPLQSWFARWYKKQDISRLDPKMLLYPCWIFDHAGGFAAATKLLAYNNIGHITEIMPTKHYELHLPSRIIRRFILPPLLHQTLDPMLNYVEQINAAKGRLRTVIHGELFKPNEALLASTCKCREKNLFTYEKTLFSIDVWPLERTAQRNSINTILNRLDQFELVHPTNHLCSFSSHRNFEVVVKSAQACTRSYFDGLCLDCMDKSKPKTGDVDMDYWRHSDIRDVDLISGCRVTHRKPTWYFSFMGRQEDRVLFKNHRRRRSDSE